MLECVSVLMTVVAADRGSWSFWPQPVGALKLECFVDPKSNSEDETHGDGVVAGDSTAQEQTPSANPFDQPSTSAFDPGESASEPASAPPGAVATPRRRSATTSSCTTTTPAWTTPKNTCSSLTPSVRGIALASSPGSRPSSPLFGTTGRRGQRRSPTVSRRAVTGSRRWCSGTSLVLLPIPCGRSRMSSSLLGLRPGPPSSNYSRLRRDLAATTGEGSRESCDYRSGGLCARVSSGRQRSCRVSPRRDSTILSKDAGGENVVTE